MKTKLSLLLLVLGNLLVAAPAELGQSEADLLKQQAKPLGRIVAGNKVVYRWPEMQVTVVGGKVSDVKLLDAEAEKAVIERRAELNAATRQEAEQRSAAQASVPVGKPDAEKIARINAINARIAVLRQEQNEATINLNKAEVAGIKAQIAYNRSAIEKREKEIARLLAQAK